MKARIIHNTLSDLLSRKYIFTGLLNFFFINQLLAFDSLALSHLGIEQGLSNNSVTSIYQDHNGFMWFGTYDGLNRYDGYGFKVFRNGLNDSASLPHNYIYAINEDLQHNLWVGTGQGIGIYNNLTSKFLPAFYIPYRTKTKQKITANINVIKIDTEGNTYIGTNGSGLLVHHNKSGIAIQVPYTTGSSEAIAYNVQTITIDKQQRIWLFILDVGLYRYDQATKAIQVVNTEVKAARCLEMDKENIWLGTTTGLYKYSITSNELTKSYNEKSGQLSSGKIAALSLDKEGRLWIGTEGGGLNIFDTKSEQVNYFLPGESTNMLTSESVVAIYEDKESRKWIGTLKGGINILDPHKNRFETLAHDPLNPNSLINNFVSSFYEDNDKNLWIGTDGGGLSIWNRRLNHFTNFRYHPGIVHSLSNNSVTSIRQDYLNDVWISTFGGGINKFNKANGSFEHFKCINDLTGKENENVWLLFEDRHKILWATTFGDGKLYRFSRELNRFQVFDQELYDLIALTEDRNGGLWAGNSHQLIKINTQRGRHIFYEIGKPVRAIYEDKEGRLWVGAEGGGLIHFNRQEGKIAARYSNDDGLCNNAVLNILEDNSGHLWLSTFNGLSEFNPIDKTFKNFYQDEGLQSNQFLYNSALRLKSGEIVFGGIKGFNLFLPSGIHSRDYAPPVLLTGLRINSTPVTKDNPYVTQIDSDKIEALRIPFNEAVISFDFAALEYSAPGKIAYAYYLEGWDRGWNYSGNIRTVNYTHLREGSYLLRIKATDTEGAWNGREVRLRITVLPPWYRSWWAYALYLIITGAAIYLYQQYRSRQAKLEYEVALAKLNAEKERAEREKERTEREKTQAQYQVEKAERQAERVINEKEKEMAEKRLSFFTNVSHEFRTPLTMIINPVKDLLQINQAANKTDNKELNTVYRNARRLLSLVDQLLLFRKADAQADKLKITKLNFYNLCMEVYLAFVQQAKASKIEYSYVCANENLELYADREKTEIILYNLISNALKYTPQYGKVIFSVSENDDIVEVVIEDSGYGIPKEVGDRLFEKFYQVQEKGIPSKHGFGIGLYLVKHFLKKHKGTVTYTSEPGKGTTFVVQLQKGTAHLDEQAIFESTHESSLLGERFAEDEPVAQDDKTNLAELVNSRKSILVVEDNAEIRQYVISIFKNAFTIYEAESGEEGLKITQQYLPDIVISDVMMQNGTGIELCRLIKENPSLSHIPVILLTGMPSDEIKLKGIEGGADDYITKPFEKNMLMARVDSILKSRSHLQQYFYNEITLKKNDLKISAEYKEFLEKCIAIVEDHLHDDDFNIKKLSLEIGMSHSNLYKKVKSISGQSISGFIRFIRLRKAAELMIQTPCNINEAAFQVGIIDIKYFRRQFNKVFGMNPSEYIKKYRTSFSKSYSLHEKVVKSNQ